MSAGIVTTAQLTDATPAAGYAHISERDWEAFVPDNVSPMSSPYCKDIARQLIENEPGSSLHVILGGGRDRFLPNDTDAGNGLNGRRVDGRNLISDWLKIKAEKGLRPDSFRYVNNKQQLLDVDPNRVDYLFGLFNADHMSYDKERDDSYLGEPSLEEMTEMAILILSKNPKGFVLLVEGGNIDKAHHKGWAVNALYDTVAFDKAIAKGLELTSFYDTLSIVTADHSHSFTINGYPLRGTSIFGIAGNDSFSKPFTTLLYGNGPGYQYPRTDPTTVDTSKFYRIYQVIYSLLFCSPSALSIPIGRFHRYRR